MMTLTILAPPYWKFKDITDIYWLTMIKFEYFKLQNMCSLWGEMSASANEILIIKENNFAKILRIIIINQLLLDTLNKRNM
jgi:hypothetical protein